MATDSKIGPAAMTNAISRQQLSVIENLHSMFQNEKIEHWLMGGWAVDFHVGRITRDHHDIDLAMWVEDLPRIKLVLERNSWKRSPKEDEDGGTGFDKENVRLELTYLARAEDGEVYTPTRSGRVSWPKNALGEDVLELGPIRCRVVSFASLKRSKSSLRTDPEEAEKDRADLKTLLSTSKGGSDHS